MSDSGLPALFLLLFAVLAVIVVLSWLHHEKLRRKYAEWAARRGFRLDPGRRYGMEDVYPTLACLQQGHDRYAYDVLTGEWQGRPVQAFHYHYETYSRDSEGRRKTSHHRLTVVSVSSDIPLSPLQIRPEGLLDKFASFFGVEDINFESAEFSRRFHVSSSSRRWAYDILHARSIEYLLSRPARNISLNSSYAAVWFPDTLSPESVEEALETLCGLLALIPDYVRRQQLGLSGSVPHPIRSELPEA